MVNKPIIHRRLPPAQQRPVRPVLVQNQRRHRRDREKVGAGGTLRRLRRTNRPTVTVLVGATIVMAIASAVIPNLNYHAVTSFTPLNMIASFPLVLVVPANHPAKTVKELSPGPRPIGKANYGTSSPAFTITTSCSSSRAACRRSRSPTRQRVEPVRGVRAVPLTITDGPPAVPLIKGGKFRWRSPARTLTQHPGAEHGESAVQVNIHLWSGFFVPTGTPAPVVENLPGTRPRSPTPPCKRA